MKRILISLLSGIAFLAAALPAAAATISLSNPLCQSGSSNCINDFPSLITTVTSYISTIVGILAVLMFIVSGAVFVFSAGNPGWAATAKRIAIYAAVGLGIALAGAGLVSVVSSVITPPTSTSPPPANP